MSIEIEHKSRVDRDRLIGSHASMVHPFVTDTNGVEIGAIVWRGDGKAPIFAISNVASDLAQSPALTRYCARVERAG